MVRRGRLDACAPRTLSGEADRDSRVLIGGNAGCRSLAASPKGEPEMSRAACNLLSAVTFARSLPRGSALHCPYLSFRA